MQDVGLFFRNCRFHFCPTNFCPTNFCRSNIWRRSKIHSHSQCEVLFRENNFFSSIKQFMWNLSKTRKQGFMTSQGIFLHKHTHNNFTFLSVSLLKLIVIVICFFCCSPKFLKEAK
jgi:Zn-finger protein